MFAVCSPMLDLMGTSRRREERDVADAIDKANRYIADMTLGRVCSAGIVRLDIACYQCPRRGRYRVTRLIDRHGAAMRLPDFLAMISADCPSHRNSSYFRRCGVYTLNLLPVKADYFAGTFEAP